MSEPARKWPVDNYYYGRIGAGIFENHLSTSGVRERSRYLFSEHGLRLFYDGRAQRQENDGRRIFRRFARCNLPSRSPKNVPRVYVAGASVHPSTRCMRRDGAV